MIDLEASASSSQLHLLWTIGGKEREALGSKCLSGLQMISCYSTDKNDKNDKNKNENEIENNIVHEVSTERTLS